MTFHLQTAIDHSNTQHEPRFTLTAADANEFTEWQQQLRRELIDVLRLTDRLPEIAPKIEKLDERDQGTYTEVSYRFLLDGEAVPLVLLIPKTPPPHKPILAFHGHGMGAKQILGHYSDEKQAAEMRALDENYAQRLARDGFLAAVVEQRGFGERVTNQVMPNGNSCLHLSSHYAMHDRTLLGERLRDALAAVNILRELPNLDGDFLGAVGHSAGGTTALYLAALEPRITHTVVSGYFCDYQASILGMPHCVCNYVPRLLSLAGIGEITALIAARHLLLINGENDPIFPYEGIAQPLQTLQRAYSLMAAEANLTRSTHENGHQFHYATAVDWLCDKE